MVGGRILSVVVACVVSGSALLGFTDSALARTFRVKDIPNGATFKCLSCHTSNSGKSFTPFGSDAKAHLFGSGSLSTRHTEWAEFCLRDSDMDGFTNGEELGDPDCTWALGDANPGGSTLTNPGKASSFPAGACGNGSLDAGEECDGTELTDSTCAAVDAGEGALACTADCTYDISACSAPPPTTSGDDGPTDAPASCSASPADRAAGDADAGGAFAVLTAASAAALIRLSARRRNRCR